MNPLSRKRLESWYGYLADQPCLKCGRWPVEIAHIRASLSPKDNSLLLRRQGLAAYSAIPLCPEHHRHGKDSIEAVGEQAFFVNLEQQFGQSFVLRWLLTRFQMWANENA